MVYHRKLFTLPINTRNRRVKSAIATTEANVDLETN